MNASRIVFPGVAQKFLAASAPKPVSYQHFWQMVIQEKARLNFFQREYCEGSSGVSYRDDNEAGGEQEEEGEPVLARCIWRGADGNGPRAWRRLQSRTPNHLLSRILPSEAEMQAKAKGLSASFSETLGSSCPMEI